MTANPAMDPRTFVPRGSSAEALERLRDLVGDPPQRGSGAATGAIDLRGVESAVVSVGTDSAPHAKSTKEAACGCAGCYTAHAGIELYAEAFEQAGALDKLEAFASFNGPDFYRLPRNADTITLVKEDWQVPAAVDYLPDDPLVPLRAGETIGWKLA